MTEDQQPATEGREPSLPELMRRLAFDKAQYLFIRAASVAHDQFTKDAAAKAEVQEGLADVKQKVSALDPELTVGVMVLAIVQNPEDATQLGLVRHSVGTIALLDTILPLAHLIREQEQEAEQDAANSVYPVCDGCGRRHPTGAH